MGGMRRGRKIRDTEWKLGVGRKGREVAISQRA